MTDTPISQKSSDSVQNKKLYQLYLNTLLNISKQPTIIDEEHLGCHCIHLPI